MFTGDNFGHLSFGSVFKLLICLWDFLFSNVVVRVVGHFWRAHVLTRIHDLVELGRRVDLVVQVWQQLRLLRHHFFFILFVILHLLLFDLSVNNCTLDLSQIQYGYINVLVRGWRARWPVFKSDRVGRRNTITMVHPERVPRTHSVLLLVTLLTHLNMFPFVSLRDQVHSCFAALIYFVCTRLIWHGAALRSFCGGKRLRCSELVLVLREMVSESTARAY